MPPWRVPGGQRRRGRGKGIEAPAGARKGHLGAAGRWRCSGGQGFKRIGYPLGMAEARRSGAEKQELRRHLYNSLGNWATALDAPEVQMKCRWGSRY